MGKLDLLTIDELAGVLKVGRSWIYRRTGKGGEMPVIRIGRYLRFDLQAVLRWIKEEYNTKPEDWIPGYGYFDKGER